MTDLDLLVAGAMVSFLSVAGAYVAIRQRANESPVASYESSPENQPIPQSPTGERIPPR
jgi:hypothetical protein